MTSTLSANALNARARPIRTQVHKMRLVEAPIPLQALQTDDGFMSRWRFRRVFHPMNGNWTSERLPGR